jgi:hypothetical protein
MATPKQYYKTRTACTGQCKKTVVGIHAKSSCIIFFRQIISAYNEGGDYMFDNTDYIYAKLYLDRARQKQKEAKVLLDMAQKHFNKLKKELEKKES